jgi:hypothetical protein
MSIARVRSPSSYEISKLTCGGKLVDETHESLATQDKVLSVIGATG